MRVSRRHGFALPALLLPGAARAQAFPDRPVRCSLVWTRAARVMFLPDDLLATHRPDAGGGA